MSAASPALVLPAGPARSVAFADRLLNLVLFVTMALSSVAFIEPSPHDAMMCVLLVACIAARVHFDRKLTPLLMLTILWLIGGGFSFVQVAGDPKTLQYFGTSVYLGIAGIMFACLFSDGNMTRLAILRRAYIFAALVATVAGYVGFFHLVPHADLFLDNGRVSATFKDPNVYGPFLIYPLLLLIIGFLTRRVTLTGLFAIGFLLGGLFLSFSRGAWTHFTLSAFIAIATLYVVLPSRRRRIALFCLFALFGAALLLIALASISSVHQMLLERAKAIEPYDVGSGGRFFLQKLALTAILENFNGMGPFGFSDTFGGQQHNVYMQCFLVYGWLGGTAYLAIVVLTIMVGFRNMLWPAPWQTYLIAAFAAFVGEAGEGLIIDSDHWRHFFLLLGLVWGLSVATINWKRRLVFDFNGAAAATPAASYAIERRASPRAVTPMPAVAAENPLPTLQSPPLVSPGFQEPAAAQPAERRDARGLFNAIASAFDDPA